MINETYKSMLSGKSVIRELNEYANDITRHPHLKPEDIFDYSLGNPSVPVPEAFNARIKALLDSGDPMLVHGYSPSLGIPAAREKIAASLNRRFGMRYTMDDIFMTSGAAGALAHAFRLVTQPGDEILTFAPFFPEYRPYTAGAGLTLRVVPADTQTFQINFDAFERMLTPAVQAVLINTPNNPSGAVYSAETLRRMAALLLQNQQYTDAREIFAALGTYEDAATQLKACDYAIALQKKEAGQFDEAATLLESISGYSDADEQLKIVRYAQGEKAVADSLSLAAAQFFTPVRACTSYRPVQAQCAAAILHTP